MLTSRRIRLHQVKCIYPAEIVPFIISIAVIVQGLIFIIVQSSSLHTVIVLGCRDTAFLIWPGTYFRSEIMPFHALTYSSHLVRSIHNACLRSRNGLSLLVTSTLQASRERKYTYLYLSNRSSPFRNLSCFVVIAVKQPMSRNSNIVDPPLR